MSNEHKMLKKKSPKMKAGKVLTRNVINLVLSKCVIHMYISESLKIDLMKSRHCLVAPIAFVDEKSSFIERTKLVTINNEQRLPQQCQVHFAWMMSNN